MDGNSPQNNLTNFHSGTPQNLTTAEAETPLVKHIRLCDPRIGIGHPRTGRNRGHGEYHIQQPQPRPPHFAEFLSRHLMERFEKSRRVYVREQQPGVREEPMDELQRFCLRWYRKDTNFFATFGRSITWTYSRAGRTRSVDEPTFVNARFEQRVRRAPAQSPGIDDSPCQVSKKGDIRRRT